MVAFRLCRRTRATLDGMGGLFADGRWHPSGVRICYASQSVSLAVLEVRVHRSAAPVDFVVLSVDIPNEAIQDVRDLPSDWPFRRSLTQQIGYRWLEGRRSAVLRVPSAVVRTEHNYLINPEHPEFSRIAVLSTDDFAFDPRLFDVTRS